MFCVFYFTSYVQNHVDLCTQEHACKCSCHVHDCCLEFESPKYSLSHRKHRVPPSCYQLLQQQGLLYFSPSVTVVSYFSYSSFTLNDHELFVGWEKRFKVKGHLLNMLIIVSLLSSILASVKLSLYRYRHTYIYLYTCTARMCVLHTSKRQLLKDLRLCCLRWILFFM